MKPRSKLFIVFLLLCFKIALSSNYTDSLLSNLHKQTDENKFNTYLKISEQFRGINTDSAIFYVDKAIDISNKLKKDELISQALNEKGVCYYYNNQHNTALLYYQKALEIDKKNKRQNDVAIRLNNLGLSYSALGKYSEAIDCFFNALKIDLAKKDSAKIAIRYNNLGIVYTKFNEFGKALEYFKKALNIDSLNKDKSLYSARLNNIGMVYLKMGKPNETISYLNKALEIDKKLNNNFNIALRYNNLGKAYLALNQYNDALNYFNKKLDFDINSANKNDIANDFINLGNVYFKLKNINKALENYNKSLNIAKQINSPDIVIENYYQLSELFKAKNDFSKAYSYFVKYQQLKDSIYSIENYNKLIDLQNRSQIEAKEAEITLLYRDKQLKVLELKQKETEIYHQQILKYWVITLATIIIIALIILFLYIRNKSQNNKHALEYDLNLYMQKALSQQMNPHFIFNTLNSIQYFLLNNDKLSSNKYLTKFAKLMRITLDNSQNDIIPLNKEIESLNLYVELEQLRFDNKFLFEIINNVKTEEELISIPPLIIQPFVENAIWHGIMHRNKPEGGQLKIHFDIENNNLKCTVEDNGIGRKKANEFKKQNKPEHISLGTQITESRIDLINKLHKGKLKINYTDLCDESNNPTGTKVEITFPL